MAWMGRIVWVALVTACGPQVGDDDGKVGSGEGEGEAGTEAGECVGEAPMCPLVGGDCMDVPPDAVCLAGEWSCPRAGLVVPGQACSEASGGPEGSATDEDDGPTPGCANEEAPPDCWDQGPGECSDAAQPAMCEGTEWVCPPGWALGGFGEGCDWPSPEGATLESGSSDGESSGTSTGGTGSSSSGGEVDDATFTGA